ncbi:CPBP family intramembrane glutamic endopeptidase [Paraliobacillus zengyii]|uniref:CPBP family intramembrane glutamic endopeptidase n=1 Tax=Paraliobacillus zengyii TaxID=2213194 RepID=UPI001F5436A6|nr:type II CAAX endopeptidase family protein [Paraliobacillus zengyii]
MKLLFIKEKVVINLEENEFELDKKELEGERNDLENANPQNNYQFGWKEIVLFFLTYLGASFVLGIVIAIPIVIIDTVNNSNLLDQVLSGHWLLYLDAASFVIALLIFKSARIFLKGKFSFSPLKQGKTYLYLVAALIVVYGSQYLFIDVLHLEDATDQIDTFGLNNISFQWWNTVLLYLAFTVITPIKEEIIYRGFLHGFLDKKFHFIVGVIVSSLVFGLLHTGHVLSATIMGLAFVLLYKLTKSLVVPILFHILWNSYAVTGLLLIMN